MESLLRSDPWERGSTEVTDSLRYHSKVAQASVIHVDYPKHVISGIIEIFPFYSADSENESRS